MPFSSCSLITAKANRPQETSVHGVRAQATPKPQNTKRACNSGTVHDPKRCLGHYGAPLDGAQSKARSPDLACISLVSSLARGPHPRGGEPGPPRRLPGPGGSAIRPSTPQARRAKHAQARPASTAQAGPQGRPAALPGRRSPLPIRACRGGRPRRAASRLGQANAAPPRRQPAGLRVDQGWGWAGGAPAAAAAAPRSQRPPPPRGAPNGSPAGRVAKACVSARRPSPVGWVRLGGERNGRGCVGAMPE